MQADGPVWTPVARPSCRASKTTFPDMSFTLRTLLVPQSLGTSKLFYSPPNRRKECRGGERCLLFEDTQHLISNRYTKRVPPKLLVSAGPTALLSRRVWIPGTTKVTGPVWMWSFDEERGLKVVSAHVLEELMEQVKETGQTEWERSVLFSVRWPSDLAAVRTRTCPNDHVLHQDRTVAHSKTKGMKRKTEVVSKARTSVTS